jgi:ABC-type branched-subunit amino acid transport system substrate-binding protein
MKMKRLTLPVVLFIFLIVVAFPVVAAPVPGVDDKTIKIGILTDFSGPGKHPGTEIYQATKVWVDYVNDQGGIHSRKLELYYGDHSWDPSRGMAEAKRLVSQYDVFMFINTCGSSVNNAVIPFIQKEQIPSVGPMAVSKLLYDPPQKYVFYTLTDTDRLFQVLFDYIIFDLKEKKPKVGIIYQDDEWGKDGLRGVQTGAKKHGITLVAEESYKRGSVDFASQVLNCKRAGADYVFHPGFSAALAGLYQEASKIGYKPLFFGETGCMTFTTLKLGGHLAKDQLFGYPCSVDGDKGIGMAKLKEIARKYRPKVDANYKPEDPLDPNYIIGYVSGLLTEQALRDCGRDITREKFVTAMENLKNFDTGGIFGPITYGAGNRDGAGWTRVFKADPEKMLFIPISDFRKPK